MTESIDVIKYAEWSWARVTEIGLEVTSLTAIAENFSLYEESVLELLAMENATQWSLGDAYIAGTIAFRGKDPTQAFPNTKGKIKTLQNYAWVCRAYKYSQRIKDVSFSHHAIVAKLSHDRRVYWLEKAKEDDYTVEDLDEATRRERDLAEKLDPDAYFRICNHYNEMVEDYQNLPDYPEKAFIKRGLKALEEGIQRSEGAFAKRKAA